VLIRSLYQRELVPSMKCGPKGEELREECRGTTRMCVVLQILRNHTHSEIGGTRSTHWNLKKHYKILVGIPTGKNPLEGATRVNQ
jgi:3-methyladenine DNA glycosylase Mpg